MAHNINDNDIQTGIQMAWHGLTNVVPVIDETTAGILYDMEKMPLFAERDGKKIVTEHFQVIGLDDLRPIGRPVSAGYTLFSNRQVWEAIAEGFAGVPHKIVSCGTVENRQQAFVSVKLLETFKAAGREVQPLLNVCWGHGGLVKVTARNNSITIVCANTLAMSNASGLECYSQRHSKNATIDGLARAIDGHVGVAAEFQRALDSLASIEARPDVARQIFAAYVSPDGVKTQTGATRSRNTVVALETLYREGKGNRGENMADVLNAVTDYETHASTGGDVAKQYTSSEFGAAGRAKSAFFEDLKNDEKRAQMESDGFEILKQIDSLALTV